MYKQVIILRGDIDAGKGKLIAHGSHAAIGAMKKVDFIDRTVVRRHAEANFRKEKMADQYEQLYYRLLRKRI